MKKIISAGIAATAILAVGGVMVAQSQAEVSAGLFPYRDASAVNRGKEYYLDYCASCHGAALEGQDNWRVPNDNGRLPAPPHDQTGHTWHHPDAQLFQIVKYGTAAVVGGGYQSDMAGYAGSLTDTQIRDVMAYIKSTWPEHIIARHNDMNARFEASQ